MPFCTPPSCLQDLSLEGLLRAKKITSEAAERLWCVVFGWPGLALVPKPLPWACALRMLMVGLTVCGGSIRTVWWGRVFPVQWQDCKRQKNVVWVFCVWWVNLEMRWPPIISWEGVCALGKKKGKTRRVGVWVIKTLLGEWVGGALLCERDVGVWCSYETCNVSSSLFYWLQQLICYPLYKLCIYKYNTMVTFPFRQK